MRKNLILFSLLLLSLSSFSQDVIFRNNGDKVECNIINEDSLTVFFTILKNGDKISTSLPRAEIADIFYEESADNFSSERLSPEYIQVKKVFGGYKFFYKYRELKFKDLVSILEENDLAYEEIKSARTTAVFGSIIGFAGGFLIGWPIGAAIAGGDPNWGLAAIGAGLIVVAIPLNESAYKKAKSAVDTYNYGIKTSSFWYKKELNISFTGNGLGLILGF